MNTFQERAEELTEKWMDSLTREEFVCMASHGRLDAMIADALWAEREASEVRMRENMKQRNEALQTELDEQCKLHSLGAEREYILLGKIARLERVAEAAREAMVQIHNQKEIWPAEVDAVDDALEALDKLGKD